MGCRTALPLTERQRVVFELHEQGLTGAEIGELLGIGAAAVKGRMWYARRKRGVPLRRHDVTGPTGNPSAENYFSVKGAYDMAAQSERDDMLVGALMEIVIDDLRWPACSFVGGRVAHDGPVSLLKDVVGNGRRPLCRAHREAVLAARESRAG